MSLLIVGTGALACLFAARLAQAGNKVTMLGTWKEGLEALQRNGVCLQDLDGRRNFYPVETVQGQLTGRGYHQALVLVKAWQTERAARQLAQCLSADGLALTLQNGLGNDQVLKAALTAERVAQGVTMLGARMLEPGQVLFTGDGKVFLGAHSRLGEMAGLLDKAGFQVEVVGDTISLQWGKLVINAAINPLSALLRVTNGTLLVRPAARQVMADVAAEAAHIAALKGIALPYPDPLRAVEDVAKSTASNYSSMLQDVLRGTPTEIDAINGAIVREGECLGAPTLANRMLLLLVKGLEEPK
jgi:2-dehydropantoate 2-reductase